MRRFLVSQQLFGVEAGNGCITCISHSIKALRLRGWINFHGLKAWESGQKDRRTFHGSMPKCKNIIMNVQMTLIWYSQYAYLIPWQQVYRLPDKTRPHASSHAPCERTFAPQKFSSAFFSPLFLHGRCSPLACLGVLGLFLSNTLVEELSVLVSSILGSFSLTTLECKSVTLVL
jgi:hypothetical protein